MGRIFAAALAAVLMGGPALTDEPGDLAGLLRGNTLIYTDPATKLETSIYFGRFGDDFDRYVPCETSVGTWAPTADGICLAEADGQGPSTCFHIAVTGEQVTMSGATGFIPDARLAAGNQLPFG